MRSRLIYLSLILFVTFSIGCSKHPTDAQIKADIENKIASDPDARDSDVQVMVNDGKVNLQGKVRNAETRAKVDQIAHDEPGVSGLDDQTAVDPNLTAAQHQPALAAVPSAKQAEPPPPPPPPPPIVVPAGTVLTVRTGQALSSKTSQTGQSFMATLAQPISVGGRSALPTGSAVSGTVVSAKAKGKIKGQGELTLALTSISVGSHTYQIQTSVLSNTEKGKGKRTAATTGGGAAGGALIGGLAGGGKGAGIGALVGAGAGLVGGALTGNKQVEIPAESALSFTLTQSFTLDQ